VTPTARSGGLWMPLGIPARAGTARAVSRPRSGPYRDSGRGPTRKGAARPRRCARLRPMIEPPPSGTLEAARTERMEDEKTPAPPLSAANRDRHPRQDSGLPRRGGPVDAASVGGFADLDDNRLLTRTCLVSARRPRRTRHDLPALSHAIRQGPARRRRGHLTAGRLMRPPGMSARRPLWCAHLAHPVALQAWRREIYPKIRDEAERLGTVSFFRDEASVRPDHTARPPGGKWDNPAGEQHRGSLQAEHALGDLSARRAALHDHPMPDERGRVRRLLQGFVARQSDGPATFVLPAWAPTGTRYR